MQLLDVLDQIKQQHGIKTNRALAEFIGIDERRVPEYYKGREPMDDDYALIAMASGRRIDELQTLVKLANAKDEKSKAVWTSYYKSIGGIAASVALLVFVFVTLIVTPTTVQAMPLLDHATETLCIMLSWNAIRMAKKAASIARDKRTIAVEHYGFSG